MTAYGSYGDEVSNNMNTGNNAYNNDSNRNAFGMTVEERMRDIEEREQKALELERELDAKEGNLKQNYKNYKSPPNWPLKQCAFARHDISRDIPSKYQNHVRKFYSLWWLVVISTVCNWIAMIWYSAYDNKTNFMSYILLPILYVLVGCPFTWMFWYKKYYRAMQKNGNISYMFFVFFGLQILWSGIMAIGLTSLGSVGVLVTFQVWISEDNVALALAMSVATVFWGLSCVMGIFMLKLAHFDLGTYLAQKYAPAAKKAAQDQLINSINNQSNSNNNANYTNNNNNNDNNNIGGFGNSAFGNSAY